MKTSTARSLVASVALLAAACNQDNGPAAPELSTGLSPTQLNGNEPAAPSGLVQVTIGGASMTIWPFTGTNFSGTRSDVVNLIFSGNADPRQIRAALLRLSGTGRPGPLAAFSCTWEDAVGNPQTNYGDNAGWVGSAIQLECGNFFGPRFHLRMFRQGATTVASAHYEILIPGTNFHEILSWELAQAFLTADIARTGLLGSAPSATAAITPAPYYGVVRAAVTAMLSAAQIAGFGLRVNADGTASVPNDGIATILDLAVAEPVIEGVEDKNFTITFGQVIPKPFCATGTTGYLYASGPIVVRMRSGISEGNYRSEWTGQGTLSLLPFNPATGQPAGAPYQAVVSERMNSDMTPGTAGAEHFSDQRELPDDGTTRGVQLMQLRAREDGRDIFTLDISC